MKALAVILMTFIPVVSNFDMQAQAQPTQILPYKSGNTITLDRDKLYSIPVTESKVTINTGGKVKTQDITTLLTKVGVKNNKVIFGSTSAINAGRSSGVIKTTSGGTSNNFTCSGLVCSCTGDTDCNDMFSSKVCGDLATCNLNTGVCGCFRL
jgi:hypothetical protein